jgi:hypothetical protein
MVESTRMAFASLGADARRIWSDLTEMFALRRQLAEEEIRGNVAAARRLAIVGGAAAVLAMTGLPVAIVALAMVLDVHLDDRYDATVAWALTGLGSASLILGLATLRAAWRRFRRDFVGLRESLAELKEDLIWLREFVESQDAASRGEEGRL